MDQLSAIEELKERLGVSERGKDTGTYGDTGLYLRREASETLRQIAQIFLKQNVDRLSEEAEMQLNPRETNFSAQNRTIQNNLMPIGHGTLGRSYI